MELLPHHLIITTIEGVILYNMMSWDDKCTWDDIMFTVWWLCGSFMVEAAAWVCPVLVVGHRRGYDWALLDLSAMQGKMLHTY